jgi:anti-sigma28 factor (negative regulator of flagellin synthesis)
MRVENGNIGGVGGGGSFGSVSSIGAGARGQSIEADESSADSVKLSGASGLVALAKSLGSSDRQSRIDALSAQLNSGSYQVNPQEVSRAVLKQMAP